MALVSKTYTWSAGQTIVAAEHNTNFDTLYALVNGNLDTANLSSSLGLVDTQLAQITTAGKVALSALTVASQATGDLIYASSSSAWTRKGIGSTGQALIVSGGLPAWGAVTSAGLPAGLDLQTVNTQTGAVQTGTTVVPYDDTIPQNTEGFEVMTLAVTASSATNKFKIDVVVHLDPATNFDNLAAALFQDTTAGALAVGWSNTDNASTPIQVKFTHYMTTGTASATTFKVRVGADNAGTITFNGELSARKYGGVIASSITISEIKV